MRIEEINNLTDRELLVAYLIVTYIGHQGYNVIKDLLRTGRWGTCGDCPVEEDGSKRPERCIYTKRWDHNLHSTADGKFYRRGSEIPREVLVSRVFASEIDVSSIKRHNREGL